MTTDSLGAHHVMTHRRGQVVRTVTDEEARFFCQLASDTGATVIPYVTHLPSMDLGDCFGEEAAQHGAEAARVRSALATARDNHAMGHEARCSRAIVRRVSVDAARHSQVVARDDAHASYCGALDDAVNAAPSAQRVSARDLASLGEPGRCDLAAQRRRFDLALQRCDPVESAAVSAVLGDVFDPPSLDDPCPESCPKLCGMHVGLCVCEVARHRARRESAPHKLAAAVVILGRQLNAAVSDTAATREVAAARARAEAAEQRAALAERRAQHATATAEKRVAAQRAAPGAFFGASDPRGCFERAVSPGKPGPAL